MLNSINYLSKILLFIVFVGSSCSSPQRKELSLTLPAYPFCNTCDIGASDYKDKTLSFYSSLTQETDKKFIKRDLLLRANLYESKFEFEKAKKVQSVLLAISPENIFLLKKYSLSLIRSGDLPTALEQLKKAYKISSSTEEKANLGLLIGSLYESTDQKKIANNYYKEILKFDPSNVEACIRTSKAISTKDFGRSIATLEKCHDERKDQKAELSFYLGRSYLNISDLSKSERYFLQAYRENPENSKSLAALAVIFQETNREKKLEQMLSEHLKKFPDDYLILSRIMDYYVSRNQYKKAVKHLEKMTDLNPRENSVKFKLVYLYREINEYRKAIRTLEEVLSMGGDKDKAYYFLADINFALDQKEIALVYLEKVQPESSFYGDSTIKLLNALKENSKILNGKKRDKIEEKYLTLVRGRKKKLDKTSELYFDLVINEALYWDKKGNSQTASELLEAVVMHDSFAENHKYFLASLYEKLGKYEDSDKLILAILKENPLNPHALNFIGYSLLEREESDLEKAYQYLSKAMQFAPNDGHVLDSYGWYLYKVGDVKKSLVFLLKALKQLPQDPTVNKHLGQVYQRLSKHEKAKEFYDRALGLTSDIELLGEIESLKKSQTSRLPASVD